MSSRFDVRDPPREFGFTDFLRDGAAQLLEAGEVPEIGKLATLLRFHRLHCAIVALEKDAGAVGSFLERQPAAICPKRSELLNEVVLAHPLEGCESRDLVVVQEHLTRPSAAGRATLTFQKNGHAGIMPDGVCDPPEDSS